MLTFQGCSTDNSCLTLYSLPYFPCFIQRSTLPPTVSHVSSSLHISPLKICPQILTYCVVLLVSLPLEELQPFLRWKLTTITANTMKAIVLRSGYRLMARDQPNQNKKPFNNWNAIWTRHLKIAEFNQIGFSQRVNHFPGSFHLGRKDRLWMN